MKADRRACANAQTPHAPICPNGFIIQDAAVITLGIDALFEFFN